MRRVLHGDVIQLARVLFQSKPASRATLLERAFVETEAADQYRLCNGQWHPRHGDGSLAGWAAERARVPEPALDDPDYAACLALIFTRLAARKPQQTQRWPELT